MTLERMLGGKRPLSISRLSAGTDFPIRAKKASSVTYEGMNYISYYYNVRLCSSAFYTSLPYAVERQGDSGECHQGLKFASEPFCSTYVHDRCKSSW